MIGSFYLSEGRILKTLRVILSLEEDKQSKNFFHCTKLKMARPVISSNSSPGHKIKSIIR